MTPRTILDLRVAGLRGPLRAWASSSRQTRRLYQRAAGNAWYPILKAMSMLKPEAISAFFRFPADPSPFSREGFARALDEFFRDRPEP